jgi:hypothetical protein
MERLPFAWIGKTNIVKMAILLKTTYIFHVIALTIPMSLITEIEVSILKYRQKHKRPWLTQTTWSKINHAGDITISDFKLYNSDVITKTA